MKLLNFSLTNGSGTPILIALGCEWDLHNFAEFVGVTHQARNNSVMLEWVAPSIENPWGCTHNTAAGCRLLFRGLRLLLLTGGDENLPPDEASCLHSIWKVDPVRRDLPRTRIHWLPDDPFNLLFHFQNGRDIEIGADIVELIPF